MWKNWVIKPFICISSGLIAQSIVGNLYELKYVFNKEEQNCNDYKNKELKKIYGLWLGIVGSLVVMRYYNIETPKLLKNE